MSELLLALVSNPNAGKSAATDHVAETYGLPVASGSGIIGAMACERGETLCVREEYAAFQKRMRDEVGPTFFMDIALGLADERGLLVDGLRVFKDFELFRSVGGITIAIWCPLDDRFERGLNRASPKDATDPVAFAQVEASEYDDPDARGIHIMPIMQMADYAVDGSKSKPELFAAIDQIVAELI